MEVLVLQSYDAGQDLEEVLEQLVDAIDLLIDSAKQGKGAASTAHDEEGEAVEPISALADLMVSLLQRPSVLLRTTVERVFAAFSGEFSEQALQLLLDQITADTASLGEEEDVDENEGDGEDNETVGTQSKGQPGDEESSDDEDEETDDEDLGIDLDADPELKAKVEAALRSAGLVGASDEDDEQEDIADDVEEDLLDDDQMMELDGQLAEIFRARKATDKGAKADQEASLNARLKVLDLLEIFAKHQAGSPLVVRLVLPLLRIANKSDNEEDEFAAKAIRVLRNMVTKPKCYLQLADGESAPILETLQAVHAIAQRASSPEVLTLSSASSLYLCKLMLAAVKAEASESIVGLYTTSWTDYLLRKRSRLQPKFFSDFIGRFSETAWQLREPILQACSAETITKEKFKRSQAFHLLADLIAARASAVGGISRLSELLLRLCALTEERWSIPRHPSSRTSYRRGGAGNTRC